MLWLIGEISMTGKVTGRYVGSRTLATQLRTYGSLFRGIVQQLLLHDCYARPVVILAVVV